MKHSIVLLCLTAILFSCKKENTPMQTNVITPTAISATSIDYTSFIAEFQSTQFSDSFKVYVASDTNFTQPILNYNPSIYTSSGVVTGLLPGTKYFYRFKAFVGNVASGFSNIISVTTKNWDGQLSYGTTTSNIISHLAFSGPVNYVELIAGTNIGIYSSRFSLSNVPTASSGAFPIKDAIVDAAGNGITDNITIGGILYIGNNRYNSKLGGTITKTGTKSFSFTCPVYLQNDPAKLTVYTVTGNCIY